MICYEYILKTFKAYYLFSEINIFAERFKRSTVGFRWKMSPEFSKKKTIPRRICVRISDKLSESPTNTSFLINGFDKNLNRKCLPYVKLLDVSAGLFHDNSMEF